MKKSEMSPEQRNYFAKIESMITEKTVCAAYSRDKKWFYIHLVNPDSKYQPRYWLSVDIEEGSKEQLEVERALDKLPKEDSNKLMGPFTLEITPRGRKTYCRKVLPFNFWKVKHGEDLPLDRDSDLFKDYVCLHPEWPDDDNIGSEKFE